MLKGTDQRLSAGVLHGLKRMDHDDDLVICKVNHPAVTIAAEITCGQLIGMAGCDFLAATRDILPPMALDTLVRAPVVGDPVGLLPPFAAMEDLCGRMKGRTGALPALQRFDFYGAAKSAFCIIRTLDNGPCACSVLKRGCEPAAPFLSARKSFE